MNHEPSSKLTVAMAFAAGALASLLAGGYVLYGPEGRKRRDDLDRWLRDTKDEVLARMEQVKDTSQKTYSGIVDEVLESYALAENLTKVQTHLLAARLKSGYEDIKDSARDAAKKAKKEMKGVGDELSSDIQADDISSTSGKMIMTVVALGIGAYLLSRQCEK